jgi:hypothetical protein
MPDEAVNQPVLDGGTAPNIDGVHDVHSAVDSIKAFLDSPEPESQPEPEASAKEQVDSAADDVTVAVNETSNEADEIPEQEAQDDDSEYQPEEEAQKLNDQSVADILEMEVDQLMNDFTTKVKVNGVEREVSLAELKNGHMMDADYRQKTMELAEHRQAAHNEIEQQRQQLQSDLGQRVSDNFAMTKVLESQLIGEYEGTNWEQLRSDDPAEYSARRADLQQKYANIDGSKKRLTQEMALVKQQAEAAQLQQVERQLIESDKVLSASLPGWSDAAKQPALKQDIAAYLVSEQFQGAELSIADHRVMTVAFKAMMYDKLKAARPEIEKKVRKTPRVLKPGTKRSKRTEDADARGQQMNRLRDTGSVDDAAALLRDFM